MAGRKVRQSFPIEVAAGGFQVVWMTRCEPLDGRVPHPHLGSVVQLLHLQVVVHGYHEQAIAVRLGRVKVCCGSCDLACIAAISLPPDLYPEEVGGFV